MNHVIRVLGPFAAKFEVEAEGSEPVVLSLEAGNARLSIGIGPEHARRVGQALIRAASDAGGADDPGIGHGEGPGLVAWRPAPPYKWKKEMRPLIEADSSLESQCRSIVEKGLAWADAHPGCDLRVERFAAYDAGIPGVRPLTYDRLSPDLLSLAGEALDPDLDRELRSLVLATIVHIRRVGWPAFVALMSRPR